MTSALDRPMYGASWGAAILRFFGNYAIFRGRASRSEYWWWALTNALVIIALNFLGGSLAAEEWRYGSFGLPLSGGPGGPVTSIPGLIALVYGLGTLLPNLALTWRRLHDTDRSGAFFLLVFIPLVGWIALFFLLLQRSDPNGRRFD